MVRKKRVVDSLYYITHIENVPSILKQGILSHEYVENNNIISQPIYDKQIVTSRRDRTTPSGKSLWSFANLYLQPRNPMLYRVLREKSKNDIVVFSIKPDILKRRDVFITTGNAASYSSDILPISEYKSILPDIMESIYKEWWTDTDGSKRKIMAECLVPNFVPPELIQSIYVADYEVAVKLQKLIQKFKPTGIPDPLVITQPNMFFLPLQEIWLSSKVSIVQGDMFFSGMQTLTVSVNCVGVMGKGLASTAKHRFPDLYVDYQDKCKKGFLKMGIPYVYKRESSIFDELADEPRSLANEESGTWFVLFPTKQHWKNKADINGIEKGLQWLSDNYKKEGISSLAIPALGCGLGQLQWRDVGPLLCKYLTTLDIPVSIYLPADNKVPREQLSRDFLLSSIR